MITQAEVGTLMRGAWKIAKSAGLENEAAEVAFAAVMLDKVLEMRPFEKIEDMLRKAAMS